MAGFIDTHATVENGVTLPADTQLGQRPPLTQMNPEFLEPIHISSRRQVVVVGPIGSRADMVTAVYGQGPDSDATYVYTGCFGGRLAMFEEAVLKRKAETDPSRAQYALVIAMLQGLIGYR